MKTTFAIDGSLTKRVNTNTLELRALYQRYITEALLLAGLLHFALIGVFQLYHKLTGVEIELPQRMKKVWLNVLPPPPSFHNSIVLPTPMVSVMEKASVGIPIPKPNAEINPETTIPTQIEMGNIMDAASATKLSGSTEYVFPDSMLVNKDESQVFEIVEILPVAILQVQPPYPEIPLKAGVEGTVYVKMLVTKEGKVKHAEVAKSTNNIFNQPAIEVALQWKFTPAIMNNGPVNVWVTVPFKFRLNSRY